MSDTRYTVLDLANIRRIDTRIRECLSRLGSRERHDRVRRTLLVIRSSYVITLVLLVIDALTRRAVRETDDAKIVCEMQNCLTWRGSAKRDERRQKTVGCILK